MPVEFTRADMSEGFGQRHRPHAGDAREAARRSVRRAAIGSRVVVPVQRRVHPEEHQVPRVEADVHVAKVLQRAQEQSGGDQQHQRDRDLRDDQRSCRARCASRRRFGCVSLSVALTFIRVARSAGAMPNTMPVSAVTAMTNARTRQSSGAGRPGSRPAAAAVPSARPARRARRPSPASSRLSVSSWRMSLAARRAEREPNRELLLPRRRAREQQVGDVGAHDQQHQRHDDAEHGDGAEVRRVHVVDAAAAGIDAQVRAPAYGLRLLAIGRSRRQRREIRSRSPRAPCAERRRRDCLHLRGGDAGLQPAHHLQPPESRRCEQRRVGRQGRSAALRAGFERERQRHIGRVADRLLDAGEFRREHADDRDRDVVHADRRADDARVAAEPRHPVLWLITATGAAVGRSSSGVMVRPRLAVTPSTR